MEDIRENGRKLSEAKQYVTEDAIKGMGLFSAGSFILATTATIGEHALLIADSLANQRFTNLKIRESLIGMFSAEFFFYYLFVIDDFCKSTTKTATFPAVDMNDLKNVSIPLPPLEEQERIAEYLDRRCAEIDSIINKEEQTIALLDELKQSIISEAVTRGLDPTAPLKPSGADWIGNIPAHWEMVKVKHKYSFVTGFTPPSKKYEYYDNDNGYTWVCISDLNSKKVSSSASKVSKLAVSEFKPSLVVKGSLLFSFKLSIGQVAFAEDDLYTNEAIASFGNEERISLSFLYYSAPYYIVENAETNIYGAKLLNQELIKNAHIIFPPLEEQVRIAEYLDKRCAEIDEAKERKQRQIELLREMKQTLISDAVTGRVKVF